MTWRDGSIGCPEPGMNYTQALVPGIRVVLELDGARYEYHAGGARSIFLCENPRAARRGLTRAHAGSPSLGGRVHRRRRDAGAPAPHRRRSPSTACRR